MKKWLVFILVAWMLCGCGAQQVFETVDDEAVRNVSAMEQTVHFPLPPEAAAPVAQSAQGGTLYLCNGYMLTVQTLSGGDLDRTLRQVTGFSASQLQPVKTKIGNVTRYYAAWTAAGEPEEQVARSVILDDGQIHYAVTVMADASRAGQLHDTWSELLNSVRLGTD